MSIEDYEKLHKNTRKYDQAFLNAEDEFILVNIGGTTADRAGFREYCYAS